MTRAGVGLLLVAAGALVVLAVLVAGRDRLRTLPVTLALAAAGAAVATGGLLLQDRASLADHVLATAVLAFIVPLHMRVAFGSRPSGE